MSSSSSKVDYLCVHVNVTCKPGTEDAFKEASLANARESSKEAGIARFDVIQDLSDSCKFVLVEVYKNTDAPAAHKETAHYLTWRQTVADMMAVPRQASKYANIFPSTAQGWDYGKDDQLE
uniref:ABM domain-containing protein n=1 Tax=Eucampia antarctica TaxID=49252 RepID=A0A7S2R409_9STRA|mmetsp:Transcript_15019/g.14499  ORF Transcript_15019/g.14499 Transcript_15019/m.14499 type:complete len:121 (+) Transcript_15019:90-452(+)